MEVAFTPSVAKLPACRHHNRWTGKELGANQNRVFLSGDLGGKRSHAFPLKTIKIHTIQIKTQYFFKISLPYALKLIKYQVSIVKSKFMEINLSKTLQNCCKGLH